MKARITIKPSSLPMGSPIGIIILFGLLLDRLAAPSWVWGVAGIFAVLLVIEFFRQRAWGVEHDVPGFGDASPAYATPDPDFPPPPL
jgi:hypothetical protein